METYIGILIPFLGTALGSACVLFMRGAMNAKVQKSLAGFAAGVMVAASVWSLIIPAIDKASHMGKWSFVPALVGVWLGVLFLLLLDHVIPHFHIGSNEQEGPKTNLKKTTTMVLAVALHNIPEGMAVGLASYLALTNPYISIMSAVALSIGIAIQNFPEGAIISMPLRAEGRSRMSSFLCGVMSGLIEPIGAILTLLAISVVLPILPYLLGFAAGAMIYAVIRELMSSFCDKESFGGILSFGAGFCLMMTLDVFFG